MGIIEKIFGTHSENELKRIYPIVDRIEALGPEMEALSDEELRGKTREFKKRLEDGETLDDILPEAYAVVREGASRAIGMRHYRVQLIGGIILHQGRIAEMKTGEGKTLVSTLPAYLNALEGKKISKTQQEEGERIRRIIAVITRIVEDFFQFQVDKSSFHYFRFKNHIKFFVQRKERGGEFSQENEELYESIREAYPGLAECVAQIDDYLEKEFGERCPKEELLYLMIHVRQLYSKERSDS